MNKKTDKAETPVKKKAGVKKKAVTKKKTTTKKKVAKKAPTGSTRKKSAAKKKTVTKSVVPAAANENGLNAQYRYIMITIVAHHRAAERNFAPGNELNDWLWAESVVEDLLKKSKEFASS